MPYTAELDVKQQLIVLTISPENNPLQYHMYMHTHFSHTTCRVSHQSLDTINSRTLLCKNKATNPITVYISV